MRTKSCSVQRAACSGRPWWILVVAVAGLPRVAAAQDVGIPVGTTPAEVQIEDLAGQTVDLAQWVGQRPVLLEFWATWCPICRALQPRLDAAYNRFGDQVAFIAVAVGVNQSPRSITRHLDSHPIPKINSTAFVRPKL